MAIDDADDRHEARPQAMDMAGLGPLTLLVIGLFSLMFSGPNYAYAIGHIGGRLISAIILALPVYVIYRYATKAGRSMAIKRLVNIFCLIVAAIWVLLAALSAAMPGMMESLTRKQSAAELGYSAAPSQPERRNSDGAKPGLFDDLNPAHGQASGDDVAPLRPEAKTTDWSQFTPIAPSAAKPGYDTPGWTQESTTSDAVGPWLFYDPAGTRYCRMADGNIHRLYPPGIRPNAEKANRFCLGDSFTKSDLARRRIE